MGRGRGHMPSMFSTALARIGNDGPGLRWISRSVHPAQISLTSDIRRRDTARFLRAFERPDAAGFTGIARTGAAAADHSAVIHEH